jgi:hypothetical protein
MTKLLTELTVRELSQKYGRLRVKVRELEREFARRYLIDRYGSETPNLKEFSAYVSLSVPVTVLAADLDDAKQILEDNLEIHQDISQTMSPHGSLIEFDDMNLLEIDELTEIDEETQVAA